MLSEDAFPMIGVESVDGADSALSTQHSALPALPDLLAPDLALLFVGYNPSVHSARRGHYYAGPGNQFWRLLALAGLTPRVFTPDEDRELLALGIGITGLLKGRGSDEARATVAGSGDQLIGQFGIGLFSSFMLAERLVVESRRSDHDEGIRWSAGAGTDIELSSSTREQTGTNAFVMIRSTAFNH